MQDIYNKCRNDPYLVRVTPSVFTYLMELGYNLSNEGSTFMSEWFILIIVLYVIYLIMKESKTTTKKSVSKAEQPLKTEVTTETPKKPTKAVVTKTTPKKPATTKATPKKPAKAVVTKVTPKNPAKAVVTKATPKIPAKTVVTKTTPKKSVPVKKPTKKVQDVASTPVAAASEMIVTDRVGSTAGSIWHYLNDNGATSVAKLIRELSEEEKIIQRSIGWLAQEGKISLDTIERVETITLKD